MNCSCRRRSAKLCRASYQSKLSWFSTLCLGVLTYLQSCALPESLRFGEPIDLFTDTAAILNSFDVNRMPRGHKHISFVFSRAFRVAVLGTRMSQSKQTFPSVVTAWPWEGWLVLQVCFVPLKT